MPEQPKDIAPLKDDQERLGSAGQRVNLRRPEELPFEVGWATERGVREHNEDAIYCFQSLLAAAGQIVPFGLFMVADGLGGQADGEVASNLAVRTLASSLIRSVYVPLVEGRGQDSTSRPIADCFADAFNAANFAIQANTDGGATTVMVALILDCTIFLAHVGDTRAYLISDSRITQLTIDHSLVARLVSLHQLSENEGLTHPQRHILYKALGKMAVPEPDLNTCTLTSGSHLVLCSDGLWSVVPSDQLIETIESAKTAQAACQALIQQALRSGSDDNITVCVVRAKA